MTTPESIEPTTTTTILEAVAKVYSLTISQILSASRSRRRVEARQTACYIAVKMGYVQREAGEMVNRDRSTAAYAVNQAERLIEQNPLFRARYFATLTELNQKG